MADRISWIKNLLGHGTTAEQQMVREAAEHARKTGNEMMLVGEQGHPQILPDFLRSYGLPTEVRAPGGYDQFMLEAGKQGIPVSTAHPHPTNIAFPSMGDYHVWANANNFYDNASNNLGSGTFLPDLARQNMWIAGPRGPNDVTHVPAMTNRGGSEDYELLRKIKELGAKNDMNLSSTGSHGYKVSRKFDDYTGSWGLSPEQRPELYGSIADVPLYNRLAGLNPIHMDPQTQLVKGRPDILAGDVFPEWMKLLDQHNLDPTKARGGQIPGYAGGGLEHIFDFLKGVTKPIRTYQGSPYKFDKFDPTKIGSGEGSAAYGHGFYSAEAPQVAQEYRRITSHKSDNPAGWMKYGMPVDDLEAQRIIRSLAGMHLPYDEDPRMMDLLAKSVRERMARGENSDQIARGLGQRAGGERYAPENIDAIKQGLPPGYAPKPPGYLYHLDINAHPNQFLDWDAPLDSPANQRIMDRIGDKHMNVVDAMDDVVDRSGYNGISSTPEDYTGRDLHRALSHHEAQEGFPGHIHDEWNDNPKINTASFLSSLDVPGVRFLDKFSRGMAGHPLADDFGTRNYVMFPQSSDLIDIVNREKARGGQIPGYAEGGYDDDPSQRYSIPPGSFGLPTPPTPTFQVPIGKGQATVGSNYDMINKIIEAQLGYEHPVGSHGARLGVSGNFNKYIGEGGDQVKPNWGVGLRLNLPFAEGGAVPGYQMGSKVADTIRQTLRSFRDAPADKLIDWPWHPLSKVAKDLPTEIPQHVLDYGDFMRDQAKKISTEGLDTRDSLKSYLTTLASMQRQAISRDALPDLKLTSDERLIRPEGAYADWLGSKWGQKYLEYAKQGEAHPEAVADAVQNMTPYGMQNLLGRQMMAAPQIVPGTEAALADQVNRASRGIRSPSQWAAATDPYEGIDAAKKGFFGSMIGYGDRPTLDARQLNLHAVDPDMAKNVMRRVDGGEQAVQRLADRQRALDFQMPWEYDPYYQHLAHHTIWDATSGTVTPHTDLIDMMKNRAEGGQYDPYDDIAEAQRLMGAYK